MLFHTEERVWEKRLYNGSVVDELMVQDIADVPVASNMTRLEFRHKQLRKAVQPTLGRCLLNSADLHK